MAIQLATPYTIGGSMAPAVTAPHIAVRTAAINEDSGALTATLCFGTATVASGVATAFQDAPGLPTCVFTASIGAQTWSFSAPSQSFSAPLTGASLTGLQSAATATATLAEQINTIEQFLVSQGCCGTGAAQIPVA